MTATPVSIIPGNLGTTMQYLRVQTTLPLGENPYLRTKPKSPRVSDVSSQYFVGDCFSPDISEHRNVNEEGADACAYAFRV